MDSWLWFAVLSFVIWSFLALIDRFVMSKHIRNPFVYSISNGFTSIFIILLLPLFSLKDVFGAPFFGILIALFSGFCYILLLIPFYKAIQLEEASRVIILTETTPLFTLLAAYLLFGEVLGGMDYLAFFLFLAAGILASHKKGFRMVRGEVLFFIALTIAFSTLNYLVTKAAFNALPFLTGFFWMRVGALMASGVVFFALRREAVNTIHGLKREVLFLIVGKMAVDFIGLLMFNYAVSTGPISLVSAMGGLMPILIFFFAWMISLHWPQFIKEEIDTATLAKKGAAAVLAAVAIGLIALF